MATIKVSDLTSTPANASTPVNPVKVVIDGEPCEIDVTAQELAALLAMFREGHDTRPLLRELGHEMVIPAPAKRATGNAKTESKTDAAALLASVKDWADRNNHTSAAVREWAHVNGFPHIEPGKAGRLAAEVWISYANAHGGPAAPVPADSADAGKSAPAKSKSKASDAGKPLTDAESAAFAALTADKPDTPA